MLELIPCKNEKCRDYNPNFKCGCERLTFLSVLKCKKFQKGKKIEVQENPELDSFFNPKQDQGKKK